MQALNYKRLNNIAHSVSPFRGSLNRFPIGNRRQNTKYFLVGEENGESVFSIVHGDRYTYVSLTKQEHDKQLKDGVSRLHAHQNSDGTWTCRRYDKIPNVLGLVRPDNTFEFTSTGYGQGDRGILSDYGSGCLSTDSRRGGTIWMGAQGGKFRNDRTRGAIPIYQGLRVDCETMRPTKPITVIGRKVNRKVGKELLARYQDFYLTTEVMTKAMDYEAFVKTMNDVVNEHMGGLGIVESHTDYSAKAETLLHTAPLDAAMLYMVGWDIGNMRWNLRKFIDSSSGRYSSHEEMPHTMFLNLKRRLNKEIYKQNDEVFKKVEYTNGEMYPPSEWGYTVMVDGVEVKQYD